MQTDVDGFLIHTLKYAWVCLACDNKCTYSFSLKPHLQGRSFQKTCNLRWHVIRHYKLLRCMAFWVWVHVRLCMIRTLYFDWSASTSLQSANHNIPRELIKMRAEPPAVRNYRTMWYHIPHDKEKYKRQYLPGLESPAIYYLKHM